MLETHEKGVVLDSLNKAPRQFLATECCLCWALWKKVRKQEPWLGDLEILNLDFLPCSVLPTKLLSQACPCSQGQVTHRKAPFFTKICCRIQRHTCYCSPIHNTAQKPMKKAAQIISHLTPLSVPLQGRWQNHLGRAAVILRFTWEHLLFYFVCTAAELFLRPTQINLPTCERDTTCNCW